jgi:hypothetical protein
MTYHLFYLAKPIYGGWVSFTAHLSLKHNLPVHKLGNRTESKGRDYGYGVQYTNVAADDLRDYGTHVITAIDKNFYDALHYFPDGTFVVIHDPSEVTKKTSPELVKHLHRFRIITIRKSVQTYLKDSLNLDSVFLLHPFYAYMYTKDAHPSRAVSISRIDFDKHIDIQLTANKHLPARDAITLYGAANLQYVFFKLQGLHFEKYYKGKFDKTFESLNDILKDAKYVVDMSVIKHDGGGTQYTFLEAIYQDCVLIINRRWVEGFATPFKDGENCFVVGDGEELAALLKRDPSVRAVNAAAKKILAPHIKVDWVAAMDAYCGTTRRRHTEKKSVRAAAKKTRKAQRKL